MEEQEIKEEEFKKQKLSKCVVDYCNQKPATSNQYGMCFRCGESMKFLLWAIPRISVQRKPTDSHAEKDKLWTPDSGVPSGIIKTS